MDLKVVVRPGEDRGYGAHVPALRGCWSQGETREAALQNIREAFKAWLETEQDKADREGREGEVELLIYYLREFSPPAKILGGSPEVSDQISEVRKISHEALASSCLTFASEVIPDLRPFCH